MRYHRSARRVLSRREFDPEQVRLILDRIERAMPHLQFEPWRARSPQGDPAGGVKWEDARRRAVTVFVNSEYGIRLASRCYRYSGAVSLEDYSFLRKLALEAA